MVSRYRLE